MGIYSNKILFAIALVLVLTVIVSMIGVPTVKAEDVEPSAAVFDVFPNPVAVGDSIYIVVDISPDPPSGYFYEYITVSIVMPDESMQTLGPFMANSTGGTAMSLVLIQTGTYSATLSYPGQVLGEDYYLPFLAGPIYFEVVEYLPPVADSVHNLDTGLDYATIQDAIDAPQTLEGHTIFVDSGTYYENVVINKSIQLIGENKSNTIIDGEQPHDITVPVISVAGVNNVVISGFTIQDGFEGIKLSGSSYTDVSKNTIIDTVYGIKLVSSSDNNTISENNIANNTGEGITLDHSRNNIISLNNITDGFPAIDIENFSDNNTISYNNIYNNARGLDIKNSSSNLITSNTLANNSYCLHMGYSSSHNVVTRNVIENNSYGGVTVFLHSNYNIISENNITNNYLDHQYFSAGIEISQASYNIVSKNNLLANDRGVYIDEWSNSNIVSENTITNNCYNGISLGEGSTNNTVSGNTITDNESRGISIGSSSHNNITENTVINNTYGISVYHADGNTIYHNNFVDNIVQTYVTSSNCTWDDGYPSGGNYWSNYIGMDSDGDSIGDTPHIIDENNTDNHPLMAPICLFDAGAWEQTQYFVDCVSNSTVSDFYFDPTEGAFFQFNVEGESGTSGFCRVTIPKKLLHTEDDWIVLVDGASVTPTVNEDTSNTYLYFTYNHSTKTIEIRGTTVIPEFQSWTLILFTLTALAVAVAIYLTKTPQKTGGSVV